MSMAPLLGLPGRIKTLLDRLTATRAANLDHLDATISTRALASTAVNSADLTTARIVLLDKLNNLDGKISESGSKLKTQVFTSSGTWTRPEGVNMVMISGCGGGSGGGGAGMWRSRAGPTGPAHGRGGISGGGQGSLGGRAVSYSYGGNGGGGAGSQSCLRLPVYVTRNQSVVVGAGGAGGVGGTEAGTVFRGANGSTGGSTSFGSVILSSGPYTGLYSGVSGFITGGTSGTDGAYLAVGRGGTSFFAVINGTYGAGGDGGNGLRSHTGGRDGQDGGPGILIVEWWE